MTGTSLSRRRIAIATLAAALAGGAVLRADDKDLLRQGSANPNVIVILSNTSSMQYLPYVQGNLPTDGQYGDSPVSKFGLAKGAFRQVVQSNSTSFNFGLSWYNYHQETVTHKYWSYQFTQNKTISGAAYDFPGDTFKSAIGTNVEWGTSGGGPILSTAGGTETFGIAGTTLSGVWFGDVPAASTCTTTTCVGYAIEQIDKSHRVAVHLQSVSGGQPYGQLSVTCVKEYQTGFPSGNPTSWVTQSQTPASNPGTVTLTYNANTSQSDAFPTIYRTGTDNGLYMGFMRPGDWYVNSDCGG